MPKQEKYYENVKTWSLDGSYKLRMWNRSEGHSDANNIRACILHFRPSVILLNLSCVHGLKTEAAPTMCLNPFSFDNENYKKDEKLSRIMALEKLSFDLLFSVHSYDIVKGILH